jgi:hypothetical protein
MEAGTVMSRLYTARRRLRDQLSAVLDRTPSHPAPRDRDSNHDL